MAHKRGSNPRNRRADPPILCPEGPSTVVSARVLNLLTSNGARTRRPALGQGLWAPKPIGRGYSSSSVMASLGAGFSAMLTIIPLTNLLRLFPPYLILPVKMCLHRVIRSFKTLPIGRVCAESGRLQPITSVTGSTSFTLSHL